MVSGRFSPSFYPPNVRYPKAIIGKPTGKQYKNATYSVRFRSYVMFKKRGVFFFPSRRRLVKQFTTDLYLRLRHTTRRGLETKNSYLITASPRTAVWFYFVPDAKFVRRKLRVRADLLFSSRRRRCCPGSAPSSSFGRFTVYTRVAARAYREIGHR